MMSASKIHYDRQFSKKFLTSCTRTTTCVNHLLVLCVCQYLQRRLAPFARSPAMHGVVETAGKAVGTLSRAAAASSEPSPAAVALPAAHKPHAEIDTPQAWRLVSLSPPLSRRASCSHNVHDSIRLSPVNTACAHGRQVGGIHRNRVRHSCGRISLQRELDRSSDRPPQQLGDMRKRSRACSRSHLYTLE